MDEIAEGELVFANVSFTYKTTTKGGFIKRHKKTIHEMVFSRQYVSTYPKLTHETDGLVIGKLNPSKDRNKVHLIYDVEVVGLDIIVRTGFINKRT